MNLQTPRSTPAALPHALSEAMRRAADAERELDRVYPLFATKTGAHSEAQSFAAELRDAHRHALVALRSWRLREGSFEDAARRYDALARLIERFAARAGLDASELD